MQTDAAVSDEGAVGNAEDVHGGLFVVRGSPHRDAYPSPRTSPLSTRALPPRQILPSIHRLLSRLNKARCRALMIEMRVEAARARSMDRYGYGRSGRRL